MLSIFLIALSLAMDAFAAAVTSGITVKEFNIKHALLLGAYFGGFQFIMPLAGWLLGSTVSGYIITIGPYISFILLAFIGGKMLMGALSKKEEETVIMQLSHRRLTVLAVATSIDALAVGVSFAFMDVNILLASLVIGAVAFSLSLIGGMLGGKLSGVFQKWAEVAGGGVLVGIGAKILIESFL